MTSLHFISHLNKNTLRRITNCLSDIVNYSYGLSYTSLYFWRHNSPLKSSLNLRSIRTIYFTIKILTINPLPEAILIIMDYFHKIKRFLTHNVNHALSHPNRLILRINLRS